MNEELDFLLKDQNILEAEISDVFENDKDTVGLSLTVGMTDLQVDNLLTLVGPDIVSQIPTAFEILLTKENLKKINKLIREYEGI